MKTIPNNSFWLETVNHPLPIPSLEQPISTDVLIVGAGISGIVTAYYILTTQPTTKICVVDARTIASGASGHNAGLAVAYTERSVLDICAEFGSELTGELYRDIESGWDLFREIVTNTGYNRVQYGPCSSGYRQIKSITRLLREEALMKTFHIPGYARHIYVLNEPHILAEIPTELHHLIQFCSREDICNFLETDHDYYIGYDQIPGHRYGFINTADFCHHIARHLLHQYGNRFSIYETTPITKLSTEASHTTAYSNTNAITTSQIVFATNGYRLPPITGDISPPEIIQAINVVIGGLTDSIAPVHAFDYEDSLDGEYLYGSRRRHGSQMLYTFGGAHTEFLPADVGYENVSEIPVAWAKDTHRLFIAEHRSMPEDFQWSHAWHGIMGYTNGWLRWVGFDRKNSALLYNLGCNGVGIIPGVFGSWKIAQLLLGKKFSPSLFDPQ